MLNNNAAALGRLLADDWVVINTNGGIAERTPFLQLKTSGTIGDKTFDVAERQTDVLIWSDGAWKSVLLHETILRK